MHISEDTASCHQQFFLKLIYNRPTSESDCLPGSKVKVSRLKQCKNLTTANMSRVLHATESAFFVIIGAYITTRIDMFAHRPQWLVVFQSY